MLITCGSGLAPPSGMLKLSGFIWLKTFGPTVAHTGIVAESPMVRNDTWPQYVPATSPPPGKLAGVIPTFTVAPATPLAAESVSHLPPSAVLAEPVQFSA